MNLLNGALTGPIVVLLVLVLLSALLRWAFSEHRPPGVDHPLHADYGLLVPVATVRSRTMAARLRTQLDECGVRSTTASTLDGGAVHILVFREDAPTAERLLSHLN